MRTAALLAACALLCGCLIGVSPPAGPSRRSELGLSISSFALSNGLRVVLVRDAHASDVRVTMRYQVGAADDPADHAGMAHLVEHLMFDHTLDGEALFDRLTQLATYFNGATTLDATAFISRSPPARLDDLLAIEAARLTTPCASIGNAEFERERAVVLNELRERTRSTELPSLLAHAVFTPDHAYHRDVGGTLDSVAAITREQACAFMDAHYAIGNAVLVVSGNLTREGLDAALDKRLAHVAPRDFKRQEGVQRLELAAKRVELTADVDHDTVLVAWALPADPKQRACFEALLTTVVASVAGNYDASVSTLELGDARFPLLGIVLSAPGVATYASLVDAVREALDELPRQLAHQSVAELENLAFASTQYGALFRRYNALEPGADRDLQLASYVAEGKAPAEIVKQEIDALDTFTSEQAIELVRGGLALDHAAVVVLRPPDERTISVEPPTAEQAATDVRDVRRVNTALEAARQPAVLTPAPSVPGMETRRLANGLQVVLIPSSPIPTVDVRLVFRVGTADEPPQKRGLAMLAGYALGWNLRYLKDRLRFERAGGQQHTDVETDRTTFSVTGMDNQLDYLLVGLRRRVRDGLYETGVVSFLKRVRRARQRHDEWTDPIDAWRAAAYGADHPYVRAGLLRRADDGLTWNDADQFRADHYCPDNATLIISGHFDIAVADRWVNFLFSDWSGRAASRSTPPAALGAASLASDGKQSQVTLQLAFPVTSTDRAAQLVAAEMLSDVAGDVRLDLGASYGTSARLVEQRLSTQYVLTGSIDASRTVAAIKLIVDGISRLRRDPALASRVFVRARGRVLAELTSTVDSARSAAAQIEHDFALGRAPLSNLDIATSVRDLTIDRMSAPLDDLDLARALIWLHGPKEAVTRGFEALGRKPTRIPFDPTSETVEQDDGSSMETVSQPFHDTYPRELADPMTSRSSPFHFVYAFDLGASLATIEHGTASNRTSDSYTGANLAAQLGYRRHGFTRVGIRFDVAALSGGSATVTMFDAAPFVQLPLSDPFWMGAFAGLHREHETEARVGAVAGAELGLDLIPLKRHWLSLFAQYALVLNSDSHHGALSFGLAYGH